MRKHFIQTDTLSDASDVAPWACTIVEVEGGFMAFESQADYEIFINQR